MAARVYMTHPELPGRAIRVRPSAVAAYERSRWQVTEEPPPEPAPEPDADDQQIGRAHV